MLYSPQSQTKISAVIVDDELGARRVLRNLLLLYSPEIEIIAECCNLMEAVDFIKQNSPSVVFLDIQMPNYAGHEIVNFFDRIDFEIIFVTAYNEFAINAFDLCAIDYLVKPIERKRLKIAIDKLADKLDAQDKLAQFKKLKKSLQGNSENKVLIPEAGNRRIIDINEIKAIEADGAYTRIHLLGKPKISTSRNLKYYENLIGNISNFVRIHRSWIINLEYLQSFNRTENTLFLEENLIAKISRSNYDILDSFFFNK